MGGHPGPRGAQRAGEPDSAAAGAGSPAQRVSSRHSHGGPGSPGQSAHHNTPLPWPRESVEVDLWPPAALPRGMWAPMPGCRSPSPGLTHSPEKESPLGQSLEGCPRRSRRGPSTQHHIRLAPGEPAPDMDRHPSGQLGWPEELWEELPGERWQQGRRGPWWQGGHCRAACEFLSPSCAHLPQPN